MPYIITKNGVQEISDFRMFETKKEAVFEYAISRIKSGVQVHNYCAMSYYQELLERVKKEYPEYLV